MLNLNYLLIIQLAVSLGLAFYVMRKLREPIRALVVRLMPIKHRISDESFNLQTRFSTLAAFMIGLILTGLTYWGIDELAALLISAGSRTDKTIIVPDAPEDSPPLGLVHLPDEAAEEDPMPEAADMPEAAPELPETSPPAPRNQSADACYIQLYAFREAERAYERRDHYSAQLSYPVSVLRMDGAFAPYKVLVGPFDEEMAAIAYRRRQGLKGFIRNRRELE